MFLKRCIPTIISANFVIDKALLDNDIIVPITVYFGLDGEECEKEEAVTFVAGSDDEGWFVDYLENFSEQRVN